MEEHFQCVCHTRWQKRSDGQYDFASPGFSLNLMYMHYPRKQWHSLCLDKFKYDIVACAVLERDNSLAEERSLYFWKFLNKYRIFGFSKSVFHQLRHQGI